MSESPTLALPNLSPVTSLSPALSVTCFLSTLLWVSESLLAPRACFLVEVRNVCAQDQEQRLHVWKSHLRSSGALLPFLTYSHFSGLPLLQGPADRIVVPSKELHSFQKKTSKYVVSSEEAG